MFANILRLNWCLDNSATPTYSVVSIFRIGIVSPERLFELPDRPQFSLRHRPALHQVLLRSKYESIALSAVHSPVPWVFYDHGRGTTMANSPNQCLILAWWLSMDTLRSNKFYKVKSIFVSISVGEIDEVVHTNQCSRAAEIVQGDFGFHCGKSAWDFMHFYHFGIDKSNEYCVEMLHYSAGHTKWESCRRPFAEAI